MASTSLSVIVPTCGRPQQLLRLLDQLVIQSLPVDQFEVIVVDDGSPEPVAPQLPQEDRPFRLSVLRQDNAGAGAARQAGADKASGEVLVFVDDDMSIGPQFLASHQLAHQLHPRAAVQGRINAPPDGDARTPFERYHARRLELWFAGLQSGARQLRGANLCSGNLSVRRADFAGVGGFDLALRRSEDAELGLRLERAGVELVYSADAWAAHHSGPETATQWLAGALRYGQTELAVGQKHPWAAYADPFRYLFCMGKARGAMIAACVLAPRQTTALPWALLVAGDLLDGLRKPEAAIHAAGLAYSAQVYRGLGASLGSPRATLAACASFLAKAARDPASVPQVPRALAAAARAAEEFGEDLAARVRGEAKYALPHAPRTAPAVIQNIGLQILLGVRIMGFCRDAGLPLTAKVVSRMMRHLFACDVHPGAEFAPGVIIAHGMALGVADGVRIGRGCILTHNLSIGAGKDAETGARGVPTLEADVHTSPGVVIVGPVTVGAGTKVSPGSVISRSIPPHSVVEAPAPLVHPRGPKPAAPPRPAEALSPATVH